MSENSNKNIVQVEVTDEVKNFFEWNLDGIIETGKTEVFKFALSLGIELNDYYLKTAIEHNRVEIIKIMLEREIDVNEFGGEFMSEAAKVGNIEVVKMLLEKGGNPTYGIIKASEYGHKEVVKLLIDRGANVNDFDNLPINKATYYGHEECVKLLLDAGADPTDAVIKAVKKGRVSILKLLIDKGADVTIDDNNALREAIIRGNAKIVELLLEAENNDFSNIIKYPELFYNIAINKGYHEIVKLLIDAKVPVKGIFERAYINNAVLLNQEEIVKHFIDAGIKPDIDILMRSIAVSRTEIVKLLLDTGIEFKSKSAEIIDIIVSFGYESKLKLLIEKGIDVTVNNNVALRTAIYRWEYTTIEELINAGVDLNCITIKSIIYLGSHGQFEKIKLLFEKGLKIAYADYLKNYFQLSKLKSQGKEYIFDYITEKVKENK